MLKFFKNEQSKINEADEQLNDKNFDEIKVIGAGLPRTGTLSLKTALTQLYGGSVFHEWSEISLFFCEISDEIANLCNKNFQTNDGYHETIIKGAAQHYKTNCKSPRKMLPHNERFWREAGGHQHMDQGL